MSTTQILDRECNETEVRLVHGITIYDGGLEICMDGFWGSVVCRHLGYDGREWPVLQNTVLFVL